MTDEKHREYHVLFLCTGNSARSIMAEAIMQREGLGKFKPYSAGSKPTGVVNPIALSILKQMNHPIEGFRSKDWMEFATPESPKLDFVFTVCDQAAKESCPIWPGQPMSANWGVPDPAAFEGTDAQKYIEFSDTYRLLYNRISIFVSLPFNQLDRISLQRELDQIGTR